MTPFRLLQKGVAAQVEAVEDDRLRMCIGSNEPAMSSGQWRGADPSAPSLTISSGPPQRVAMTGKPVRCRPEQHDAERLEVDGKDENIRTPPTMTRRVCGSARCSLANAGRSRSVLLLVTRSGDPSRSTALRMTILFKKWVGF